MAKRAKKKAHNKVRADKRSREAYKITGHIKKSAAETLQEVRSGAYVKVSLRT